MNPMDRSRPPSVRLHRRRYDEAVCLRKVQSPIRRVSEGEGRARRGLLRRHNREYVEKIEVALSIVHDHVFSSPGCLQGDGDVR